MSPSPRLPSTILLASAFVLAALIVVQMGRAGRGAAGGGAGPHSPDAALAALPFPSAEGISRIGDYTVMTFNAGSDEALAVLDGRAEDIYFYRVKNSNQFEFLGRDSLSGLFATAKKLGPGKK